MFWKYNTTSSAEIDTLLSKEDVSLQEVMDSDEIITECRGQNKNLIDFLLKPDIIEELVTLTTKEPSAEINEKIRFKYPNIASELLTCDVPAINERLAGDERLLEKLYTFLENDVPLNPLLASYVSKIMGALIAKKTEQNWLSNQFTCLQVLDFLKARDTFLPLLIKHLGTSAIMDLMLKLMTQVEGVEKRQNILNWLDSQRIIQQLVSLLNPKIEKERHDNVAQLFCDFIRIARDNQRFNSTERVDPDPLLNTLESPDTVGLLLSQIFSGEKCESSIIGGIQVLLAILDVNQTSIARYSAIGTYNPNINEDLMDMEQKQRIVFNTTETICTRLKDFHELLLNPPKQSSILTTAGQLDPPLGNTRLQVVKLISTIIPSNYTKLYDELISLSTFPLLLDLFFHYPWNNFLHTQVEISIISALKVSTTIESNETIPSNFCKHLLEDCNLIERILKAWKNNDEQQAEGKGIRQGYMGHLISIMNNIIELCSSTSIGQYLKDLKPDTAQDLETFKETTLSQVNLEQQKLLAGVNPNIPMEDSDEFNDDDLPQCSAAQQQSYTQYQMQHLRSQYIDVYSGLNDDAFNDGENTLQTIDYPSDVNFDLSENYIAQRDEIFKQVCAENINTLYDGDDQTFEEKDHTFQTVIEKQGDKNDTVYSSDSDEGSPSGDDNMDVDPWTSPKPDPWSALASSTNENTTSSAWADFSSATFVETPSFAAFNESLKEVALKDSQNSVECITEGQIEDSKKTIGLTSAASGDHNDVQQEKLADNQDLGDKPQPSISHEGELLEEKPHMPLEPVQTDKTEKV